VKLAGTVVVGAGGGIVSVDMNQYNLSFEHSIEEWTAELRSCERL
jgi:CTP-dependent riboflavin kinase